MITASNCLDYGMFRPTLYVENVLGTMLLRSSLAVQRCVSRLHQISIRVFEKVQTEAPLCRRERYSQRLGSIFSESIYTGLLYPGFRLYRPNFQFANRSLTNVSLNTGPAFNRHILYRSPCIFKMGREKYAHCKGGPFETVLTLA